MLCKFIYLTKKKKEFIIEKDIVSHDDNNACYHERDYLNHK